MKVYETDILKKDNYFFGSNIILTGITFLFFISYFVICVLEQSFFSTSFIILFLLFIGSFILFFEAPNFMIPLKLLRIFWITFLFRFSTNVIFHLILVRTVPSGAPFWHWGGDVGGDEFNFFNNAHTWAQVFLENKIWDTPDPYHYDYQVWIYCLGLIRYIGTIMGGDTAFNLKLLSCFFTSILVPYIYLFSNLFFDKKISKTATILSFFLPDYLFFGASLVRDTMISFFLLYIFYQFYHLYKKESYRFIRIILPLFIIFFLFEHLRTWLNILTIVMIFILFVWPFIKKNLMRLIISSVFISFIFIPTASLTSLGQSLVAKFLYSGENIGLLFRLNMEREGGIESSSENSVGAKVLALPLPILTGINMVQHFLFIPPWAAINEFGFQPRAVGESLICLFWLGLTCFLPPGIFHTLIKTKNKNTIWLLGPGFFIVLFLSLASAVRLKWRLMVLPYYIILIARGIHSLDYFYMRKYYYLSVSFLMILYLFLKYY